MPLLYQRGVTLLRGRRHVYNCKYIGDLTAEREALVRNIDRLRTALETRTMG